MPSEPSFVRGAIAGFAATGFMTAAMVLGKRFLPLIHQYRLPPRQITETMGIRAGYVYKTEDNLIGVGVPGRDARNGAYSVPFTFNDIGADNVRGSADDQVLTLYGMPRELAGQFPLTQVVENLPRQSRYDTVEVSMNRRYSNRWSASIGGAYTWMDDFPATVANSWPRNPNLPGQLKRTVWNLKATGSYDAAWGIRLSPVSPVNGSPVDDDPQATYGYVVEQLDTLGLAYLHVIEGVTQGPRDAPHAFDYAALRRAFRGRYMANNGYDRQMAIDACAEGRADLVAFGRFGQGTIIADADRLRARRQPQQRTHQPLGQRQGHRDGGEYGDQQRQCQRDAIELAQPQA